MNLPVEPDKVRSPLAPAQGVVYESGDPVSLVEVLRRHALERGDAVALICLADGEQESQRMKFDDLDVRVRAVAAFLQAQGLAGQPVLLMLPSSIDYVVAFLGCLYAGVVAVPAHPPLYGPHAERLVHIARDCGARAALYLRAASQTGTAMAQFERSLASQGGRSFFMEELSGLSAERWSAPGINGSTLAFLQYTSGSIGDPRGVMITHRNLLENARHIHALWGSDASDVGLTWLPLFHDMGIGSICYPLYVGATNVILPPLAFLQKPMRWLNAISRYRATISVAPNFAFDLCLSVKDESTQLDLSSWRVAGNAAEPVREETIQQFAQRFGPRGFNSRAHLPGYGLAESTLAVTMTPRGAKYRSRSVSRQALQRNVIQEPIAGESTTNLVGCGSAHADTKVLIVNPDTRSLCRDDEIGEIWIRGPSVAAGYWNCPEDTRDTFHAYTSAGEGPFLRSGDLGAWLDGALYITGRQKELIIKRGSNHYPQDIERTAATSCPNLEGMRGAAFSIDGGSEEQLVMLQEVHRSHVKSLNGSETVQALREAIAEQHGIHVHAVLLLKPGTIPVTSSGKVQRRACRVAYLQGRVDALYTWRDAETEPAAVFVEPQPTSTSYETVSVWMRQAIAKRRGLLWERIGVDQPMTSFGLDSLEIAALSGSLSSWLDRELSPTLVYDYPTIRLYAQMLTNTLPLAQPTEGVASSQNEVAPEDSPNGIAIVGMACRFPGADSVDAYWNLLQAGADAIREVPPDRWSADEYHATEWPKSGKMNTRWGGFIDGVDLFDAQFFGVTPLEAQSMDPQQRLLLSVAWHALEDAGIPAPALAGGNAGVFVGINTNDYRQLQLRSGGGADAYAGTGNAMCIAANRVSYFLDVHGPSWSVDSACSSSLVALHQARVSLLTSECDVAIVGAVNLILAPENTIMCSQAGMLSPDGRCKTFDASANGYVRSEGCGVLVLKRHADAVRNHDRVHALVAGSAVNQDGRSNGLTAPNGLAQQAVIRQALANAGAAAEHVSYIEAQGTASSLGDSIEMGALRAVYGAPSEVAPTLWVGAVKTNIGHLEAAAGVAAIIKTVLMLQHRSIPKHLHLQQLNPLIALNGSRLAIPASPQPWHTPQGTARLAGVSAFGFGGANAHVLICEAPGVHDLPEHVPGELPQLLTFSAKDKAALSQLMEACADFLAADTKGQITLSALCYTLNARRTHHFPYRTALLVDSVSVAKDRIRRCATGEALKGAFSGFAVQPLERKLTFLMGHEGAPYGGAAQSLYRSHAGFRAVLSRCDAALLALTDRSLLDLVDSERDSNTALTPPGCTAAFQFAMEFGLASIWQSCGVQPDYILGQGASLFAAACVAGVFSLEDGLKLAFHYGCRAASTQQVSDPGADAFAQAARDVQYSAPKIPVVSSMSGQVIGEEIAGSHYWVDLTPEPVQLADSLRALDSAGCRIFIEVTQHPVWSLAGQQILPVATWLHSLRRDGDGCTELTKSIAQWYVLGGNFDGHRYAREQVGENAKLPVPIHLPNYPFQQSRHWFTQDPDLNKFAKHPGREGIPFLLGTAIDLVDQDGRHYFEGVLGQGLSGVADHYRLMGVPVLPLAALVECTVAAACQIRAGAAFAWYVEDLMLKEFVSLSTDPTPTQTVVTQEEEKLNLHLYTQSEASDQRRWKECYAASISPLAQSRMLVSDGLPDVIHHWQSTAMDAYYDDLASSGPGCGSMFRGLKQLWRNGDEALGRIECAEATPDASSHGLYPPIIEACMHMCVCFDRVEHSAQALFAVAIRRLRVWAKLPPRLWCHVRWLGKIENGRYAMDATLLDDAWNVVAHIEEAQFADALQVGASTLLPFGRRAEDAEDLVNAGIADMPVSDAKRRIIDYLFLLLIQVTHWDAARQAELRAAMPQIRLNGLGLDSLMAMQLQKRILSDLQVDIPINMFFSGAVTSDVADLIYRQIMLLQLTSNRASDAAASQLEAEEFVL